MADGAQKFLKIVDFPPIDNDDLEFLCLNHRHAAGDVFTIPGGDMQLVSNTARDAQKRNLVTQH